MDEEIKEVGEMATIEGEEEITIEEDYTTLEAETIIIDDDSNIQTDAEYEQAVEQKELADGAREALSAVLLSVLEKGEINDDDITEIVAQQEIYTENVTALKILGLTTEDEKSTTNVITSNIDYNELIKVLSEKADWLYIDEDGQVMLNGEVVPKLKVVELEAEKIKADVGEFKNLTTENFTATNATIENLKANKADIEYLNANYATIENLNATNANVTNLQANKANITDLNATNAEINNLKANKADITFLEANYATIHQLDATNANVTNLQADTANINNALINKANVVDLNATNANITNLQATKANITDLDAANANINTLTGNLADITTLVNGNLTSDNIQSMVITGDKFTVANGFIKNAMIDSINANKINAGTINTNNVNIQSNDGSMVINGNTQQFKDKNNKVRIQIGKDASGNFTFALFSQDGVGVLIDENGIKSGAVPNGLIVNDMVSDGANISGSKLDINSVISSINNGTTVIKGTRVQLDEQGQSLQVAFSQLKSKVETIENISIEGDLSSVIEQVTTNTTSINTMQGQISSLISNTTITKANGEVVQLKDEYNSTKSTVDTHSTKIGSLETNLATANNNISSVSSKQTALEQNLNGFKQTVSQTYTTKADFNGLEVGGNNILPFSSISNRDLTSFSTDKQNFTITGTHNTSYDGIIINPVPYITSGQKCILQFKLKKNNGTLTNIGCHFDNVFTITKALVDGVERDIMSPGTNSWGIDNTNWHHVIIYFTYKGGTPNGIAICPQPNRILDTVVNVTYKDIKVEIGNKPSAWSPCIKDIQSDIATVDGKFTNYSTTSQMNSAINQKANEITSTVSETYATKASLTTVDNKFANYSTTSAMNSAINQKANEITSTVSETYATKTSLKATDDKFANYSTTSAMNSAINQKANEITSTVSQTYATKTEFNNLNVGGRNLLVGCGNYTKDRPLTITSSAKDGYKEYSDIYTSINLEAGEYMIQAKTDGNWSAFHDGTTGYNPEDKKCALWLYRKDANGKGIGYIFANMTNNPTKINVTVSDKYYLRLNTYSNGSTAMTVKFWDIKLEKGNKATGWSPAPEDISSSISAVDDKFVNYSTTSQMNSAINQKADSITQSVSNTYATKSALTTVDNKFANYSTTSAMNSAINQKSDAILSTVSNTYATKTALSTVDGKFANYSTTSQMNSAINQKSDSILSTVSSTYTTKSDFNGLTIGGTNLYPNSNFKTQPQYFEQSGGSRVTWDSSVDEGNVTTKYNGKVVQLFDSQGTPSNYKDVYLTFGQTVTLQPNTTYTLSFDYYSAGAFVANSSYIYLWKTKGVTSTRQVIGLDVTNNNKNKTRLIRTFTTDSEHLIFQFRIGFADTGACWLAVDGVKLEKGNRATEWSPAPEDIDSSIATVDGKFANYSTTSQMNSAINQKANEITSTVSETYATKSALKTVDNKFANYSTTSAMNTAINQKADSITQSVSNTYATKTSLKSANDNITSLTNRMQTAESKLTKDSLTTTIGNYYTTSSDVDGQITSKGYATTSQLQQTATDLTATFNNGYKQGVTQINADGIKIYHNKINGENYTRIAPSGFWIKYKGENIFICDQNGLSYKGTITGSTINGSTINGTNINADSFVGDMLAIDGVISAKSLQIQDIDNAKYPATLDGNLELYVNSSSGNDDNEPNDNVRYKTLQGAIDAIPKFLNGKTVYITMETNSTEDVYIRGVAGGAVRIYMNGKTLYGTLRGYACSATINIYGGTKDSTEGATGIIHPSTGMALGGRAVSVGFEASQYVALYKLKVFAPDNLPSDITNTDKACVGAQSGTGSVYCKDVEIVNAVVGVRANNCGNIHVNTSSGIASKYAFQATTGGTISLASNNQAGGVKGNTNKNNGGQVWYDSNGPKFATGNQTTDSGSAPVVSGTKTITIKSTYGDTYRSSVYNNWKKDGTVRQGDYGYGDCTGCWFFGSAFSELKGCTISKVEITITRQSGGSSSSVGLVVRTHNYSSRPSGAPTLSSSSYGTLSLATGQTNKLTITHSDVLNGIKNGTVKGFGIRTTYDSAHYAVCSGSVTVKITYTE